MLDLHHLFNISSLIYLTYIIFFNKIASWIDKSKLDTQLASEDDNDVKKKVIRLSDAILLFIIQKTT